MKRIDALGNAFCGIIDSNGRYWIGRISDWRHHNKWIGAISCKGIPHIIINTRYQVYFSILELIANGMTSQSQIDSILGTNSGRYLNTLEEEYNLIQKVRPMFAKPNSHGIKYALHDNFLTFWFRFIESNRSLVEMGKMDLLKEIVHNGYVQFSGWMLERYFRQMYAEKERTTEVGRWWNTRSEDEIDMIAIERLDKRVTVAEVKRNANKINIEATKERFANIRSHFRGYEVSFIPLSLEDM